MKKTAFLLALAVLLLALCSLPLFAAENGGFYDIGTASGLTVIPRGTSGAVDPVTADPDGDGQTETFYPASDRLTVRYDGTAAGREYTVMLLGDGSTRPDPSTLLYIDQIKASGSFVQFTVFPKLNTAKVGMTLLITSDEPGFTPVRTLLSYAAASQPSSGETFTVTGRVRSFNPKLAVTLTLTDGSTTVTGSIAAAASGDGEAEQSFTIPNVPEGTYTLVVEKTNHLSYTLRGIPVFGNRDVGLLEMLAGDLNGDTFVDALDITVMSGHLMKGTRPEEGDLDGDSFIDALDITLLSFNLMKSPVDLTY